MANFNFSKAIIGGRMASDPELKTTPSGISMASFSVAVRRRGKNDVTDFLSVTAWRATAEFISRYFRKGASICVVGTIQTRSWTDSRTGQARYATEIVADEAFFVDSKAEGGQVVVTPDSAAMQGVPETAAGEGKPAVGMYGTPGARGQFESIAGDEDLPF